MKKTWLALVLGLCLMCTAALGDTISFSGTVEASETAKVYAPSGVTFEDVLVKVGEKVTADTVIARLKTTKVYAQEDGTVASVFGRVGDDAATVAGRYGAVMYVEGPYTLMISTTTSKAYEAKENYIIHSGETVYLVSRNHTNMKGMGMVTAVEGSSYTVLVTEGEFLMGDSISICRESNFALTSCIGRGNVSRVSPTAVTGDGVIVSCAVQPGDQVKQGQLLFETVSGTFDSPDLAGTEIRAGVDGVVASLSAEKGSSLNQTTVAATIYPKDAVWVAATVTEADLEELSVGQKVQVELDWNQHEEVIYDGTVEMISALGTVGEESTTYPVYISFTPDENTRYSMSAVVTTLAEEDGEEASETAEEDGAEAAEEEAAAETEQAGREGRTRPEGDARPEMPEGMTPPEMPEGAAPPEMPETPAEGTQE